MKRATSDRRPSSSGVDLASVSSLAEAVREELRSEGVSDSHFRLRPVLLGGELLPQFPVIRGGAAEQAAAPACAESVLSVMRSPSVLPFDGMWRLMTEGTAFERSVCGE